jgi:hypothetical protein
MPSIALLDRLIKDFPALHFKSGPQFEWQPKTKTVIYDAADPYRDAHLLHETAHARLDHVSYERDIDLIKMERDAWELAKTDLGPRYEVAVPTALIHHDMDTYRDWLHARSTCPACGSSGIQIEKTAYRCVSCTRSWTVNEARTCALRRFVQP